MRHGEYWMAGIGLALVAVLAVRELPRERPGLEPNEEPPNSGRWRPAKYVPASRYA